MQLLLRRILFRGISALKKDPRVTYVQPHQPGYVQCTSRHLCTTTDTKDPLRIDIDKKSGIANLVLQKYPANTLSVEFMTDLCIALDKLENTRKCRGLILSSAVKGIFSGGIELKELYKPREERIRELWRLLQDIWLKIYGSRFGTVAAINGHAPAGGCLLAIACDHRIMADGRGFIGLSGAKFGISPPLWLTSALCDTVGQREAEKCIATGHMYSPDEALQVGLVDAVVPNEKLLPSAQDHLTKLLKIPDVARQLSKENMRHRIVSQLLASREKDIDDMMTYLLQDQVQQLIGSHLEKLKTKEASSEQ